ncbi:MAG: response regulator, partial [Eubacterium sp.]
MRIAVVDDLPADRAWLAKKLKDYMDKRAIAYTLFPFASGEDFLESAKCARFDIVFMDIYMNGMTGIQTADALRYLDMDCKLVFLTTSEEHLRQGYSMNPCHYLIKPPKDEDFLRAMENCRMKPR